MTSTLYISRDDGTRDLSQPEYEYTTLKIEPQELRLFVLQPCKDDRNALANHVSGRFEVYPVEAKLPDFVGVYNARGYRLFQEAIEVDGKPLIVSVALERFLRHFRRDDEPVRIWVRHLCLDQPDPAERETYWTREFSDAMYERATERVDMSEIVADLRERNIIERVIDLRFRRWTKLWDEVPQKIELPKVFPIRLGAGSKHDPGDVHNDFEYVPLDTVADEIRVLVVMPSEDSNAPIVTHLGHCPIKCEVNYQAISYTWGEPDSTGIIIVNGLRLVVRKNLEEALRIMRHKTGLCPVWIDAVCIDQQNIIERNRQVDRMSEIYDNAVSVIAWVGPSDEDSKLAIDFLPYLAEPMMRFDDQGDWICQDLYNKKDDQDVKRIPPDQVPRMCGALYQFLCRPYLRRTWILQELAVATAPTIVCGHQYVDFARLEKASRNLQDMIRRDSSLAEQMVMATPGLKHVDRAALNHVRTILFFRHLSEGGGHWGSLAGPDGKRVVDTGSMSPGYLETAILTRNFEATIPSDKLYALWNLAKDKDGFEYKIDYSLSTEQVFTSFAAAWARHTGSLDIIGASEVNIMSHDFYTKAPSWAPDWRTASNVSCLVRREMLTTSTMMMLQSHMDGPLYSADGGIKQSSGNTYFHFEDNVLRCSGIILDTLECVAGLAGPNSISTPMETFIGRVFATEDYLKEQSNCPYDDPAQAAWAAMHGDNVQAWPPREENLKNADENRPGERYVCLTEHSRHIKHYADSYSRTDSWDTQLMVMRGRECAITEQNYVALVPGYVKGMERMGKVHLAILATCSVPVLLQEISENTYRYLGTAFVQGWMEGKIIEEMRGDDTAVEFWQAISESGRLRIV